MSKPLALYDRNILFNDAKTAFEAVKGVEDPLIAEPVIERVLMKHLGINIKRNRVVDLTPEQFEELKTDCLTTIQMAYLTVCNKNNCVTNTNTDDKVVSDEGQSGWVELSKKEIESISEQFKTQFKRAFWDKITEDLKMSPPNTEHLIVLLGEIRDMLNNLTPNNQSLVSENSEAINPQYLALQFKKGDKLEQLLGEVLYFVVEDRLKRLVAPAWDEELQEWWLAMQREIGSDQPIYEKVPIIFQGVYNWLNRLTQTVEQLRLKHKLSYQI